MRFSSTVYLLRYRIKFAHTARYKSKPHPAAINTNNIAIFPNFSVVCKAYVPVVSLSKDGHHS